LADGPVLDSDVLIDYLRGAGPGRDLVRELRGSLGYRMTAVTAFELSLGRGRDRNRDAEAALLAVRCLALDRGAAVGAGSLLRQLHAEGVGIEFRDAMQAGICREAGATLLTSNIRHFAHVPGLQVITPRDWPSRTA
jgi:tRNA(fMet)-specific endonuclease VapC